VLEKVVVRAGRTLQILINEKPHEFCEDFRLYLISMLPSPTFTPETSGRPPVLGALSFLREEVDEFGWRETFHTNRSSAWIVKFASDATVMCYICAC